MKIIAKTRIKYGPDDTKQVALPGDTFDLDEKLAAELIESGDAEKAPTKAKD